jgi:restriction system protein
MTIASPFGGEGTYHFPAELLALLIDTIPRLLRTKRDVLMFFRGAGVPETDYRDLLDRLATSPSEVSKFALAREVLGRLNAAGDGRIAARREIIRRVVEFEDFSACYDNERDAAKARVAEVRRLVDARDSFTRMRMERDREAEARRVEGRQRATAAAAAAERFEAVRDEVFALFAMPDPHRRGTALEAALNHLFELERIAVREAFTVRAESGHVGEQIDGAIELNGRLYLVEMKWIQGPVDKPLIAEHLVRLFARADCGGIVIATNGFTQPAIDECRNALRDRTVILCRLQEIVEALQAKGSITDLLKGRIERAILDRDPGG